MKDRRFEVDQKARFAYEYRSIYKTFILIYILVLCTGGVQLDIISQLQLIPEPSFYAWPKMSMHQCVRE